ncbi:hypothetical protein BC351_29445 [Paenibacillus ferrarius]|uniref:SLH domain-containing protein n=1 Tax=Paenibacillus ferrarius TaxID=1469647 RepID=A0A1V4HHL5_9BACL|nr:Ig-like domain-containing protein [Paenibacillus ferrarius]OPH56017.1 hypothetical protein BC351_29445 [Paenibacillus ferrarius]
MLKMKSVSIFLLSIFLVFSTFAWSSSKNIAYASSSWKLVGNAGFSKKNIYTASLAIAPDGTPYVAYPESYTDKVTVMKFNKTLSSWELAGNAGLTGKTMHISLAIAPDGTPYVAYQDNQNGGKAMVMKLNGEQWEPVGAAGGISTGVASDLSLAIALDGTPYVAYLDGSGNYYVVTVKKFDGSNWKVFEKTGFNEGEYSFISLAIAPDGTPYVAYHDLGKDELESVMKFNGISWEYVGFTGFTGTSASLTSVKIARDGTPYFAFRDGGAGKAIVMKFTSAWEVVGNADFSASQVASLSLALAPGGTPYVSYIDMENGQKATVMKFNGANWETVGTEGFSEASADPLSLAIDANGIPYVAYSDEAKEYKATVMAFLPPTATAVTNVTLDKETMTLTAGGATGSLTATVYPSNATNQKVTWSSSNESVATVDATGVVTPKAAGTATITVTTEDGGKTATSEVTVQAEVIAVTSVVLDPSTLSLAAGGSAATVTATVYPSNATNKKITWSSSNESVATVDATGVVTPKAAGTATITVTTEDGGKTATSEVTVQAEVIAVTSVVLDPSTLSLAAGGSAATVTATVYPSNATNKKVTWSSSNESVATVDATGVVTPKAAGTATITVTTEDGGKTATSEVTVQAEVIAVTSVVLDPSTLSLAAGGSAATVTATVYPSNATNKKVTWSSSNESVATVDATGVVTPKAAGTATITVITEDGGKTATSLVTVKSASPSEIGEDRGGGGGSSTPAAAAANVVEIYVNGKVEHAGIATTTIVNDRSITTVAIDAKKLDDRLAAEGQHAVITIPVKTSSAVLIGELTGQMVKSMEQKQALVVIQTEQASYTLPAQQINIDAISGQLGKSMNLQDIKIRIEISKSTAETTQLLENSAAQGQFTIIAPTYNFTVTGVYGDKTIEVSKFNAYVERTIAIPAGVDPNRITTGVVVDKDGTVRHVPTVVSKIDGTYYAKMNSLTNSTYSVIWHPLAFTDVENHWAKNAVNDMGSRMVINGTGNGLFAPDQAITRAEFAAIMVRGLGIKKGDGTARFKDVKSSDWYSSVVQTAYAYNLISGFEDGTFRPNDSITREQAMAIIARAMRLTGLKDKFPSADTEKLLMSFADAKLVSDWAKSGIADCLQAGVVSGRNSGRLAPNDNISRAEVATIIQRFLQKSKLI